MYCSVIWERRFSHSRQRRSVAQAGSPFCTCTLCSNLRRYLKGRTTPSLLSESETRTVGGRSRAPHPEPQAEMGDMAFESGGLAPPPSILRRKNELFLTS